MQRLLEHEQFKNAAEMLNSKRLMEDAMWSHPGIGEFAEAGMSRGWWCQYLT